MKCVRYYLLFDSDLKLLLDEWGLGQQGAAALREGFCTRRLIENFSAVWVTVLLLSTLLDAWLNPLIAYIRKSVFKFIDEEEDPFTQTCNEAENIQQELVSILSTVMMCSIFGSY